VSDLADIHVKTLKYMDRYFKSLILNCGYGKGHSVLDIVNIFKKKNNKLIIDYKKRRPGDVAEVYSDTKKFRKILKWKPKFNNLDKIIGSAIKWEKKLLYHD